MLARLFMVAVAAVFCPVVHAAENPVFEQLTTEGVPVGSGDDAQMIKLPEPSMADGLDAAAQKKVLDEIFPPRMQNQFLRNSIVARSIIRTDSIKNTGGQRIGQRINIWFVAHGSLKTLTDENIIKEQLQGEEQKKGATPTEGRELTEEELQERDLTATNTKTFADGYQYFNQPLLEKVQLSGVNRTVVATSDNSIIAAVILDPRFNDDPKFPNQWRPHIRTELGTVELGDAQPYQGLGGYGKVTPLVEPQGALLIEAHIILNEPTGWFQGANLLGSKMPAVIDDTIKKFRRKLKKAEEK